MTWCHSGSRRPGGASPSPEPDRSAAAPGHALPQLGQLGGQGGELSAQLFNLLLLNQDQLSHLPGKATNPLLKS
jgi:hypothetical protein